MWTLVVALLLQVMLALGQTSITVTEVKPANAPTAGATGLTIRGTNFLAGQLMRVQFDTQTLTNEVTVVNNTELTISTIPSGLGRGFPVTLVHSLNGIDVSATSVATFSYDPPVVEAITPSSFYADTQAQVLTVTGRNFGTTASDQLITLRNTVCPSTTWVSDTELTCTWSTLTDNTQSRVTVTAGKQESTSNIVFLTFSPVSRTFSVYPEMGPTIGGELMTVNGASFLSSAQSSDGAATRVSFYTSNNSFIGFTQCVQYVSPSKLLILSPWGTGKDLIVKVQANSYTSYLADARFSFYPPIITSVCFDTQVGSTYTGYCEGSNFGVKTANVSMAISSIPKAIPGVWVSDSKFTFSTDVIPAGSVNLVCYTEQGVASASQRRRAVTSGIVIGTLGVASVGVGVIGDAASVQTNEDVTISLIRPNSDNTRGGRLVTIHGFNFGTNATQSQVKVQFPNSAYSSCTSWKSPQQIVVTAPAGFGLGHVIIKVGNQLSKPLDSAKFEFRAPEIYTISPLGRKPGTGNTTITIRGRYFGWRDSEPKIKIGGYVCDNSEIVTLNGLKKVVTRGWVSDSEIFCRLNTADTTGAGQVVVDVGGLSSEKTAYPVYFSFMTPRGVVLPTAPTALKVLNALSSTAGVASMQASWKLPYNTGSGGNVQEKILRYHVQVSSAQDYSKLAFDDFTTNLTQTIQGLTIGKTYFVRVAAINSAARGPWAKSSKVAATIPSAPRDVTGIQHGTLAIQVKFKRPVDTGAGSTTIPLIRYLVQLVPSDTTLDPASIEVAYNAESENAEALFTGLLKALDYQVRVAAINEVGSSVFTNGPNIPAANSPEAVQSMSSSPSAPDALKLNWAPPLDQGLGSSTFFSINGYEVAFSSSEFGSPSADLPVRSLGNETLTTVYSNEPQKAGTPVPLVRGQEYFFAARATSIAGKGKWSEVAKAKAAGAPTAPRNVKASSAVLSAVVTWEPPAAIAYGPSETDDDTYLQEFHIDLATEPGFTVGVQTLAVEPTNTSAVFTGLTVGKLYFVRARAVNTFGWMGAYSVQTNETIVVGGNVPSAPLNLVATNGIGQGVVSAAWGLPLNTGDGSQRFPLQGFRLEYSQDALFLAGAQSIDLDAAARQIDIPSLSVGASYYLRVAAINSCGIGAFSAVSSSVSPIAIPGSPTSLSVVEAGSDLLLSWTAPTSGAPASYRIGVYSDEKPTIQYYFSSDVLANQYILQGLSKGYKYTLSVSAGNLAGYSSPSTAVTMYFQTLGEVKATPNSGPLNTPLSVLLVGRVFKVTNTNLDPITTVTTRSPGGVSLTSSAILENWKFTSEASGSSATFKVSVRLPAAPGFQAGPAVLKMTVLGQELTTAFNYDSDKPGSVVQLAPSSGLTTGGYDITLILKGFAEKASYDGTVISVQDSAGVARSGKLSGAVFDSSTDQTVLTIGMPFGAAGLATLNLKSGLIVASLSFEYYESATPAFVSVTPQSSSALGGNAVTVAAQNFAGTAAEISGLLTVDAAVYALTISNVLASNQCGGISGRTCYVFTLPKVAVSNPLTTGRVVVTKAAVGVNATSTIIEFDMTFYQIQPEILSLSPATGVVDSSVNFIDILMQGFDGQVTAASQVSVSFGGVAAVSHTLTSVSDGYIRLRAIAPLSTVEKPAVVTVTHTADSSISATSAKPFTYLATNGAEVVSVEPSTGSTRGGSYVSIRLKGATASTAISATFTLPSGVTASGTVIDMVGDDLVIIKSPASPSYETGAATVSLVVGSVTATFYFTYATQITTAAVVELVQPTRAAIGETITVVLTNFNPISSASDVAVTIGAGGKTAATVSNIQTGTERTVLSVVIPDLTAGLTSINVAHTEFVTNAGSSEIVVVRKPRCMDLYSADGYAWYNQAFGSLEGFSDMYEKQCRALSTTGNRSPVIVNYSPDVGYLNDANSKTVVSFLVDHLPGQVGSQSLTVELYDSYNSYIFLNVDAKKVPGYPARYLITGNVPAVTSANVYGIITLNDFSPPVQLPFEFNLVSKPTSATPNANLVSISSSEWTTAGGQEVIVILSNFVAINTSKTVQPRIGNSVTDVSVQVAGIPCTVVSAYSDPYYTTLKFRTPAGQKQLGTAAVRITNDANLYSWNLVDFSARYAFNNYPEVAWMAPTKNMSALPADFTFAIDLRQEPEQRTPHMKQYYLGSGPSPMKLMLDGVKLLTESKNNLQLTQRNGMLFIKATLYADDFIGVVVRNKHYVQAEHISFQDPFLGGNGLGQNPRAYFDVIPTPTDSKTPLVISVTPSSGVAGVAGQVVTVIAKGLPQSALVGIGFVRASLLGGVSAVELDVTSLTFSGDYTTVGLRIPPGLATQANPYIIRVEDTIPNSGLTVTFDYTVFKNDQSVLSISPSAGATSGGTRVEVVIQSFPIAQPTAANIFAHVGSTKVGVDALKVISPGVVQVSLTTPPGLAGISTVSIATDPRSSAPSYVAATPFTYASLHLVSVYPTQMQGPDSGGSDIVFRIQYLPVTDLSKFSVIFGRVNGLIVSISAEDSAEFHQVTVRTPAHTEANSLTCVLSCADGSRSYSLPFKFSFVPSSQPSVESLFPAVVNWQGGQVVEARVRGFPFGSELDILVSVGGLSAPRVGLKRSTPEYSDIVFVVPNLRSSSDGSLLGGERSVAISITTHQSSLEDQTGTYLTRNSRAEAVLTVRDPTVKILSMQPSKAIAGGFVDVVLENFVAQAGCIQCNSLAYSPFQIGVILGDDKYLVATDLLYSKDGPSGVVTAFKFRIPLNAVASGSSQTLAIGFFEAAATQFEVLAASTLEIAASIPTQRLSPVSFVTGAVNSYSKQTFLGGEPNLLENRTSYPASIRWVTPTQMVATGNKRVYMGLRVPSTSSYAYIVELTLGSDASSTVTIIPKQEVTYSGSNSSSGYSGVCDYTYQSDYAGVGCELFAPGSSAADGAPIYQNTNCKKIRGAFDYKSLGGCQTERVVLSFIVPQYTISTTSDTLNGVLSIAEAGSATTAITRRFSMSLVNVNGAAAHVGSLFPSFVPMTGGTEMRISIFNFNAGALLTLSAVRVFLGSVEATVLDLQYSAAKSVIIFIAPKSMREMVQGVVVPANDAGRAVAFTLAYSKGCDYDSFCGERGADKVKLARYPPRSTMCLPSFCAKENKLPQLVYGANDGYVGAANSLTLGVKYPLSLSSGDMTVSFGNFRGAVIAVTSKGPDLAEITVVTPVVQIATTLKMSLRSLKTNVGTINQEFTFFEKPMGTSTLSVTPALGSIMGGTSVQVTLTNFPKVTSTAALAVTFGGTAAATVRIMSSTRVATTLVVTTPQTSITGLTTVSASFIENLVNVNTGTADWTYENGDSYVAWSYPATGWYQGGFELIAAITGFPTITSASQVNFTFSSYTVVAATSLLYSDAQMTKVKVQVPKVVNVGEVNAVQRVKVQHSTLSTSAGLYAATFPFMYVSSRQTVTVDWIQPQSMVITGGKTAQLRVLNLPTVTDYSELNIIFGNLRAAAPASIIRNGIYSLIDVIVPAMGAPGPVKCEVYRMQDADSSILIGRFAFEYTAPALTMDLTSSQLSGGKNVSLTFYANAPSSTTGDWSVMFGSVAAIVAESSYTNGLVTLKAVVPQATSAGTVSGSIVHQLSMLAWRFDFTYTAQPRVVSVLPKSEGSLLGGTLVYVTLQDFPVLTPDMTFRYGPTVQFRYGATLYPEVIRSDQSSTVLSFRTPRLQHPTNDTSAPVLISHPDGYSATFFWNYSPECFVTSVVPAFAPSEGGARVTITGKGFPITDTFNWENGIQVRFGNMFGKVIRVITSTSYSYVRNKKSVHNDTVATDDSTVFVVETPASAPGVAKISLLVRLEDFELVENTGIVNQNTFSMQIPYMADWSGEFAFYDKFAFLHSTSAFLTDTRLSNVAGATQALQRESWSGIEGNFYDQPTISVVGSGVNATLFKKNFPVALTDDVVVMYGQSFAKVQTSTSGTITVSPPLRGSPSFSGATLAPLQVSYLSGTVQQNMAILPTTVYSTPGIVSAVYDKGRAQLRVTFDMPTNKAGILPISTDCGQLLTGQNFGIDSYCLWETSSIFVVNLGAGASIVAGDPITIVPGKLGGAGLPTTSAAAGYASGTFALEEDILTQTASAAIEGPQQIGPCDDLMLSAGGSTPMASLEYHWGCSNDEVVNRFLMTVTTQNVMIPSVYMTKFDFSYEMTLSLKIARVEGMSNVAMATVYKRVPPILTTTLKGPRTVKAGLPFFFEAGTGFSGCPVDTGTVVFDWAYDKSLIDYKTADSSASSLYTTITAQGPMLTIPAQAVGKYEISIKVYIATDPTTVSTASATVTVIPGPISAAIYTGLPIGCDVSRTQGKEVGSEQVTTATENGDLKTTRVLYAFEPGAQYQCQRATTVSSKKTMQNMPVLLTPVAYNPSSALHAYTQYTVQSQSEEELEFRFTCESASGIPCKGFGAQRPEYNLASGPDQPVEEKFFDVALVESSVRGGGGFRPRGADNTTQFVRIEVQPVNNGTADGNPFYDTDVVYNEPLFVSMAVIDPSTGRRTVAKTQVSFAPVAGDPTSDFLLNALSGVYIDDDGAPYVRPNEAIVFTLTTGRQPAPLSTTVWTWEGDNQPSITLLPGKEVTIPASVLRAGQFYTLRGTPSVAMTGLMYDEITFYVDTPPTRGRCIASIATESMVTVTCSDFAVVGGVSPTNPTAAQLTYQYGYYQADTLKWAWFETSTDSTMTLCIPDGTVHPWVKISNYKGSSTYSKAVFTTTPTYYTSVAALADPSAAYGGVNGNTIGGKYKAWSQLARLGKISQCAYVWGAAEHVISAADWNLDVNNLISYTYDASRGNMASYGLTQGISTLNAAAVLANQQGKLTKDYYNSVASASVVNAGVAAKLCTVSDIAKLAAKSIKVSSDLATVRAVSLAPYQNYPLSVADYPTVDNVTAAVQVIGDVSKTSQLLKQSTVSSITVAGTTCGISAAQSLSLAGDMASAALSQRTVSAAALPRRVSNTSSFDLKNSILTTTSTSTGSNVSYDGFVLNAYYDANKDEEIFKSYYDSKLVGYTTVYTKRTKNHPPGIATTGMLPYGRATTTDFVTPTHMLPVYDSWAEDPLYLGSPRTGQFPYSAYTTTTFRATSLADSEKLYNKTFGANAPASWISPATSKPSIRAGEKDFYVNYRVAELPTNWAYTDAIVSNAVYGYTIYPSLHYVNFEGGLGAFSSDVFFSKTSEGAGLLQTDASVFGPIEIVIPVTTTPTLPAIAANKVACVAQDFSSGSWSIAETWTCKAQTPVNDLDTWTVATSVGSGCRVGAVTTTTVTCICWGKARLNVMVQEYDHVARCPDCENTPGGGKVVDLCGVCGGDSSSCKDCKGLINGTAAYDACGECGGNGLSCIACDGQPNSTAMPDACGVCDGDNSTCLGCTAAAGEVALPIPAGGKVYDGCGVCGGNNQTCMGCDNVPYSTKKFDKCGICGGNSNESYPQFGYTCVGRFITPEADTRVTIASGNSTTFLVKVKASDNNNKLLIRSWSSGATQIARASFVQPKLTYMQVGENITGTFTWTPKHIPGESNDYTLILELQDKNGTQLETRSYIFSVVFCQYVAASGDTLGSISQSLFGDSARWRTLWWLNPEVSHKDEELLAGTRIEIGRRFKVAQNDTLEYYVGVFGGTYSRIMNENPLKLHYLQGGSNFDGSAIKDQGVAKSPVIDITYDNYYRRISYDGKEFCLVSEMDSYTRYSVAKAS